MQFLAAIDTKDWLMIVATILGPILAVQAQKAIERWRSRREGRLRIFHVLMATRATRIAPEHVQALNQIDLEFLPSPAWRAPLSQKKDKDVVSAWALYSLTLGKDPSVMTEAQHASWNEKLDELFYDLLHKISLSLGFEFDKAYLAKGAYYPSGHSYRDRLQNMVLEGAAKVLAGERALKMAVTEFPFAPATDAPPAVEPKAVPSRRESPVR